eukprot:gene3856-4456_t
MFIEVPKELSVVPLPRCTFTVETKFFANSSELKNDLYTKSSYTTSGSLNVGYGPIKVEAEASYSQEKSFKTSVEMEAKISGTVLESTVQCSIYNVDLNDDEISFSLNFLRDIAHANGTKDFLKLIEMYGTHYYKSSILGGVLKQITSIDEVEMKDDRKKEVEDHVSKSMSIKVNSPKFNVHSEYSDSQSSTNNEESEKKFSEKTSKSSIITYGGAPGAYGPSNDNGPTNFGEWAQTIDTLPIPVNAKLDFIHNIIPNSWKTPSHTSIREEWMTAENLYYQMKMGATQSFNHGSDKKKTKMIWFNKDYTGGAVTMRQALRSGSEIVESSVEFTSIHHPLPSYEHYVSSASYFQDQYAIVEPQFKVDWVASKDNVLHLESTLNVRKTTFGGSVPLDGHSHSDIEILNNVAFISTDDIEEIETNYLFDTKASQPYQYRKKASIWTANYFEESGRILLMATSIDYTPNYHFFSKPVMHDYNWYDSEGPKQGRWYFPTATTDMESFFIYINTVWKGLCPAATNYDVPGSGTKTRQEYTHNPSKNFWLDNFSIGRLHSAETLSKLNSATTSGATVRWDHIKLPPPMNGDDSPWFPDNLDILSTNLV